MKEIDCPTCSTLAEPIRHTAYVGKIFYLDSRYYVMCDECGLRISTNAYREWLSQRESEVDDEKPDWSAGEELKGDDYVKWIRQLRGEEE